MTWINYKWQVPLGNLSNVLLLFHYTCSSQYFWRSFRLGRKKPEATWFIFLSSPDLRSSNDIFISSSNAGKALITEPCEPRVYLQSNMKVLTWTTQPLRPHWQRERWADEIEERGERKYNNEKWQKSPLSSHKVTDWYPCAGLAAFVINIFIMLILFILRSRGWGAYWAEHYCVL